MKLDNYTILLVFLLLCLGSLVSAQDNMSISKIKIEGNETLSKEFLLKQMNSKALPLTEKLAFWKSNTSFTNFTLDEDILRIKKLYQQNGFLDPEINYELLANKRKRKLKILISIKEGQAVQIDSIYYLLPNDSEHRFLLDSIKKVIPAVSSKRFTDESIIASEQIIRTSFSSHGYPFVEVDKGIKLNEDQHSAQLTFTIEPGNKSFFGQINLIGDSLIPSPLIFKHIEVKEKEVFSQEKMESTQKELYDLGLFRFVTIRAQMDSAANNIVPIVIQVKELPRWSLKTGLGYGTEDKFRVSLLLTRLNFLGGGRTFILKGQRSYFIPVSLETKFIQPDIFRKDLDLIVNPFFSREREESYRVDRLGTALTLQKTFRKNTSYYLSYSYGKDIVDLNISSSSLPGSESETQNNIKSAISSGFSWRTTDNIFSPTKGWKISASATYTGLGFSTQYNYYKIRSELAYFHPLTNNIIIATKLKGGVIQATQGDLSTPIEDRFLMGGATSLRGWGRNLLSPVNSEGEKIGGNTLLEGSLELRFPIYGIFSGTAFIDFGNNWIESWEFHLGGLHYDTGIGLRLKTPVGPIRLDLATPIINDSFKTQFFITIGHAF